MIPEVTVRSWKPQEVDWSFEDFFSAKEWYLIGTNYVTTWSTRSRIVWTTSGATAFRAQLPVRQLQLYK